MASSACRNGRRTPALFTSKLRRSFRLQNCCAKLRMDSGWAKSRMAHSQLPRLLPSAWRASSSLLATAHRLASLQAMMTWCPRCISPAVTSLPVDEMTNSSQLLRWNLYTLGQALFVLRKGMITAAQLKAQGLLQNPQRIQLFGWHWKLHTPHKKPPVQMLPATEQRDRRQVARILSRFREL